MESMLYMTLMFSMQVLSYIQIMEKKYCSLYLLRFEIQQWL